MMLERCETCRREFKSIWDYPQIEITSLTESTADSIPKTLTLSNEAEARRMPRSCEELKSFLERVAGSPQKITRIVSPDVVKFFVEHPETTTYSNSNGWIYSRHYTEPERILCAPNRADEIKKALFQDFALQGYMDRLREIKGKIVPPGVLNPGFADFSRLRDYGENPGPFLILTLKENFEEKKLYLNIETTGLGASLFRETGKQGIRFATLTYRAAF